MRASLLAILAIILLAIPLGVHAQEETCTLYFTGIGCPHCAKVDPVLLGEMPHQNTNLVFIEYEIYQKQANPQVFYDYNQKYPLDYKIPLLIFNNDDSLLGDITILNNIDSGIEEHMGNGCPLDDGSQISFSELDITTLPGNPSIWHAERVLTKEESGGDGDILRDLLLTSDIQEVLSMTDYEIVEPEPVALSGSEISFDNAIRTEGWLFQWNGEPPQNTSGQTDQNDSTDNPETGGVPEERELSVAKIVGLAAVDAVNPCAFAVLSLMLIAIITYNPAKRRNILLAGFAFVLSVFVMYIFYGLVIIRFFQLIQALTSIRLLLYQLLGFAAIILGILNIKDFIKYKPGGLGTEMPMRLRPKVKRIISGITSPRGAFLVGAFVTVFLLPCTIGPYVIAGGILSAMEILATIPWLLIYNAIFVLPMVAITFIVYAGMASIENVSEWKDKNIKYLHLIAGIIIVLLGIGMVLGLI